MNHQPPATKGSVPELNVDVSVTYVLLMTVLATISTRVGFLAAYWHPRGCTQGVLEVDEHTLTWPVFDDRVQE